MPSIDIVFLSERISYVTFQLLFQIVLYHAAVYIDLTLPRKPLLQILILARRVVDLVLPELNPPTPL